MSEKKVVILDYQLGNLFSVKQACIKVGLNAVISSNKKDILEADAIILPGVGAFMEAMSNMRALDIIEPLKDFVAGGKPLFGICLGQQLLFTESEEFGTERGLNFINGSIRKFPLQNKNQESIKVPQIGWNQIHISENDWHNTPLQDVQDGEYMYFVHSYYVIPEYSENISSVTNYEGVIYSSSVIKTPNIFACQFHPEKSGDIGIKIYNRWAKLNNLI